MSFKIKIKHTLELSLISNAFTAENQTSDPYSYFDSLVASQNHWQNQH
jgi:hypothetical protein